MSDLPQLIALCGNPGSGKSEAQKFLNNAFGYQPVDDGEALRDFAISHFGLSIKDVYTQEGKDRYTEIANERWQNRNILGTLGKQLEEAFGEHIMPWMATRKLNPHKRYSFGSVRKTQGAFFKQLGGIVIEIQNPDAPASPYEFDRYDQTYVDATIINDGLHRGFERNFALLDFHTKLAFILNGKRMDEAA
jgi:hypothetical protein